MAKKTVSKLYFLYDAASGPWGAAVDSAKKLFMLKDCPLCTITHTIAGEKSGWKTCRDEIGLPVEYLHKDELHGEIADIALPGSPAFRLQATLEPVRS